MREVDSSALRLVAQALGIGNPHTVVGEVLFDDGVLQQVLNVMPLVRRAGTLAPTTGIYASDFDQAHVAAGALLTTFDPYAPASPGAGWPSPVPLGFDAWLLSVQLAAVVGDHSTTNASRATILIPGTHRAFGDAAPTNYSCEYSAHLGEIIVGGAGTSCYIGIVGSGLVTQRRAVRIPRGATIQLQSISAAVGAATMTWQLFWGLFPSALGQDAFGAS